MLKEGMGPSSGPTFQAEGPRADYPRMLSVKGKLDVTIKGLRRRVFTDFYHHLLTLNWPQFIFFWVVVYLTINLIFATLFWLDKGGLAGARPGAFEDAFYFSVQTLGTIGYGVIAPKSHFANALVAFESFISFAVSALSTGLIFARVSRPTARVVFSRHCVVTPVNGVPTLMFRAANERANQMLEAEVQVILARNAMTLEGAGFRTFQHLALTRARSPFFALSWSVMHPIDENSPLFGETVESLIAARGEIVVVLSGIDEALTQRVHARHSYLPHEIIWNRRFADIFVAQDDGSLALEFDRFHAFED